MKRKEQEQELVSQDEEERDEKEASEKEEDEIIDVDFDFFDPREIDFHGLKSLLRQTFLYDADRFDLSGMADAIISQPHIGSIVKVDDSTDPYAVMTILSFETHSILLKSLADYLSEKAKKNDPAKAEKLNGILKNSHVGFLVNERLVNMPSEIVSPMLKMLLEEMEWSVEERHAKRFEYLILISKTFAEDDTIEPTEENAPKKRKKANKVKQEFFNIHAEDEVFHENFILISR
ncbi:Mss4p nuclear export [Dinochytrium kinnereticum]|nr:Mss4p nuclear export [Dinochytrium kinnereticum]